MIEQIKKIAEQVEENESKKLLLESEITHLEEVLKHGVTSRFAEENAIYIYSPKTGHEIRKKLEDDYKLMQSKLSIPKKIAEEVDEFAHANWANWQFYFYSDEMSEDLIDWLDNGDSEFTNAKIALAYLNPLTRPFVEVTDE